MRRCRPLLLAIVLSITSCSDDWITLQIVPGFSGDVEVVPDKIESVLVEVVDDSEYPAANEECPRKKIDRDDEKNDNRDTPHLCVLAILFIR